MAGSRGVSAARRTTAAPSPLTLTLLANGRRCKSDETEVGGRRPIGTAKLDESLADPVERLVHLVLQAQGPAHGLGVEAGRGQQVHHLPVAIARPDLLPGLLADVADVEFFVALVDRKSTRLNSSHSQISY